MQTYLRIPQSDAIKAAVNKVTFKGKEYKVDGVSMNNEDQETFYNKTMKKNISKIIDGCDMYCICYGGIHS